MKKHYLYLLFIAILSLDLLAQVPSYVPTNGLVGWWPFNGNANDESGNGNNGTVNGATLTTDRFGVANGAYGFNGVNCCGTPDPVQEIVVSNQILNLGQNFTISCWMSSSTVGKFHQCLFNSINHPGFAVEFNSEHVVGKLTYALGTGNSWDVLYAPGTSTSFQNNTWYHVVFIKNGTTYALYLNGVLDGTTTVGASANYTQNAAIRFGSIGGGNEVFKGSLDDYGIWNRALTSTEISGLQNATASTTPPPAPTLAVSPPSTTICAGSSTTLSATANAGSSVCASSQLPTGLQSGLLGYWPFCGNADDASGNGNNGTVNGATLTTDRFGNTSSAYTFDGVNDLIRVPHQSNLNLLGNYSISIWFIGDYQNTINNWTLISKRDDNGSCCSPNVPYGVFIPFNSTNYAVVSMAYANGNYTFATPPNSNPIASNIWQNAIITNDSGNLTFYLNGSIIYSTFLSNALRNSNISDLLIGSVNREFGAEWMNGKLDDIGIWNRTLTASEIQQLYTLGNATYSWSPGGATTSSITVSPTSTTTYTCTATANGVSSTATSVVTVTPAPTITATNTTVCAGQSTTLSVNGGQPSSSNCIGNLGSPNPWPYPTAANAGYIPLGTFGTQTSFSVSMWVNPSQTQNGVSIILDASHGGGANWVIQSINSGATWAWGSGEFTLTPNAWQHLLITYNNGSRKVFVNGAQVLSWTQLMSYSGTPALTLGNWTEGGRRFTGLIDELYITTDILQTANFTPENIVQNPSTSTFGLWHFDEGTGTSSSNVSNVSYPLNNWYWATRSISSGPTSTVAWSPGGATTPSITVTPTTTTTYTCTVTDPSGTSCVATQTITVNPIPNVNAGADISVCSGSTATLTATGATTYSWTNSVQNAVAFTPTATTTYTVTGTSNGCTATDAVTVTAVPTPTITTTNTSVCAGQSTTLTANTTSSGSGSNCPTLSGSLATGLVGYWPFCGNANDASGNGNNGLVNGATLTTDRFGNVSSAYGFDGNDLIQVSNWDEVIGNTPFSVNFWVKAQPYSGWILAFGTSQNGQGFSCGNWHWGANQFGAQIWLYNFISATQTNLPDFGWNLITLTYESNTLKTYKNGVLVHTQNVNYVSTNISSGVLNFGKQLDFNEFFTGDLDDIGFWNRALTVSEIQALYTTGQTTYSWSNGATTPSITVSPTATTTYTCTVTDPSGTSCVATQTITVNPIPNVNAGADISVCSGSTATLTATGATTYVWDNNIQNGVAFTPTATTTYTVTGTSNGCTATDAVTVTVVPTPTITTTNTSVCAGQSTTLTASTTSSGSGSNCPTLSGSLATGLVGYWPFCGNANDASGNGNNGTVNGATLTTDRFGSASSAYSFNGSSSIDIGVNGFSTGNNQATLSGWVYITTNPAGVSYIVGYGNPNVNGSVFATGVYGSGGLFGTFSGSVYDAISNINCPLNSWNLVTTVKESNGTIKIYLNGNLIFTQTVATPLLNNVSGRIGRAVWNSSEYWNGKIDDVAIWNRALTAAEVLALYNNGQTTYSWSNGATSPSITVTPTTTTTYTCTVTDANGNSCSASQTITVIPFSSVNAGADQTICAGGTATLTATGATSYSWNNLVQNGVAFSPVSSSSYIVTGTQNGCTDSDTVLVTVVADPTITNPVSASYCQNGGTVTPLSVSVAGGISSAYAYQWYVNTTVNNFGGTAVLGATTSIYTPPINNIGTVYYYCTVTQGAAGNGCLATSGANSIVVTAQPTITSQPLASQSGCVGATLTPLSLAISGGNGIPTYQWYANTTASTSGGSIITGATSSSYVPSNTTAGTYYFYCVASYPNATSCATKTSNLATITFINDPIFNVPPTANQSVCVGGSIPALTFVSNGGSGTPSYQWYAVNGSTYTTILGATNPSYTPPTFSITGTYAYAVAISQTTAGCASGYSPLANVTVVADPNVSSPSAANYCQGGAVSNPLSVTATGGINSGYSYQWFSNGSNNNTSGVAITGATAATYAPPTASIGNLFYYCLVSQGSGCATSSAPAGINIVPGPALISQPLAAQSVCVGSTLNAFNVAYSGGSGTPSYQWFSSTTNTNSNGTPISGATNASYTPGANAIGQVYYYCVISFNALTSCSSISSTPGQVNVIANPVFSVTPLSSQTICQGANPQVLSFTTTGGSGTATYQWYNVVNNNYTPIIGANGLTYTPSNSLPAGTYNYAVAMNQNSSGCSTGFSPNAQLIVLPQPVVSTPQGGVYCQGGTINQPLSVSVIGGNGSSSYQWYQSTTNNNSGGTAINGATNSSFTPSLVNFGTLYYYCAVTQNAGCAANSAVATVVSNPSPVISAQPVANQTICIGSSPSPLSTSYTGGVGTPSYQWYVNNQNTTLGGTPIAGANASAYIPGNQVGLGTNYYYCVVTLSNSSCAQATTNIATVNTVANPILNGPNSASYCQSTSVAQALSVSASGGNGTSYSYQWYSNVNNSNFGGNPILGANNPNYTPNINASSANYYCVVTQIGGCQAASAVAAVDILPAPSINSQPIVGQTLCVGGLPQALSISINGGVSNPSFQWYSNTVNTITNATLIANASASTYTPTNALTTGTTFYFCQVNFAANSACPTLVSNAATIIVASDPAVSNPSNANYCQNATSVTPLTVTASGGINTAYLYQWYSNTNNSNIGGTPIAGANTSTYVPLVNQVGTFYYYCEVAQGSGCATLSDVSTVVVGIAANINQQPTSSQNVCLGQAISPLTVGVSAGNYAVNYQWYSNINNNNFGGSVIVGATNAFYNPPSNALGTKYYYCVITIAGGGCGNLTSSTSGITVLSAPTMFQPNSQTICCQSSTTPINFVGNANTYSWTASGSSALLTGYTSTGNGNIPSLQLTNNSTIPQNIVYLVTPSNAGCNGTPVQFNISVMPCLSVVVPADQYYCAGETVASSVFSGVGQTYSWVNTNTTVGLQNAGINFVPNFVAQNTTATTQIATITVTPNFMGCAGTAQSYSITVYPLPIVDAGVDQEICSGGSVTLTANGAPNLVWDNGIVNGQTFIPNATTTYTVTGTDVNGCQNSDVVVVTVNNPTSATLNVTSCDAYTLNGQTYTASGTYSQLLTNSNGCDSTLTLNLSLNFSPSQPNIYVQNQVNLSTDLTPGLTYQWIQCSDLSALAGQTAITYNPTTNVVYAVVVSNSCGSDTSLCTSITTIGLSELLSAQILLYPNPNNGVFTLEMPANLIGQAIQIFDMSGRLIQEITAQEMKQLIELKDIATGSYWLRIGVEAPLKLVKN